MRILHLFPEYLPGTMVWAHTLLRQIPQTTTHIAALQYLPNDFPSSGFIFWPNPTDKVPRRLRPLAHRWFRITKTYDRALTRYIQDARIELLHLHFGPTGADYAQLGERCGIPVVVSFYGFDYQRILLQKPIYHQRYQRMFQLADAITGEGPHACQTLANLGCPLSKIHLLPLGVETSSIPFVERTKQPYLRLVQIAAIAPYKGQLTALEAYRAARCYDPNIRLDFYGPERDPAYARRLRKRIAALQLQSVVSVYPALPATQLHQTLLHYHAFIHPSQHTPSGDQEGGAPVVLLDAMATGLPIITTSHCDIPFIVTAYKNGIVCPEGDIPCLQRAIICFAKMSKSRYTSFARAARKKVVQSHTAQQSRKLLSELYKYCLSVHAPVNP